MNRIKLWIVEKIRNALGVAKDYENLKLELKNQLAMVYKNHHCNASMIAQLDKELDFFKEMCEVGVDIHMHSESWAVVCLNGKKEYVKFCRLESSEARDVLHFLKRFEKSNRTVDAPMGMRDLFNW